MKFSAFAVAFIIAGTTPQFLDISSPDIFKRQQLPSILLSTSPVVVAFVESISSAVRMA
jgi:hypothetical protein